MRSPILASLMGVAALLASPGAADAAIHLQMNFTGVVTTGSAGHVFAYDDSSTYTRSFVGEPVTISLSLTKDQQYFYVDAFTVTWADDADLVSFIDLWAGEGVPQTGTNESFLGFYSTVDLYESGGAITIFPTPNFIAYTDSDFGLALNFVTSGAHDPLSAFSDTVTGGGDINAYLTFVFDPLLGPYDADSTVHFTLMSLDQTRGVPEPATWAVMLLGFIAVGATVRRRAGRVVRPLGHAIRGRHGQQA